MNPIPVVMTTPIPTRMTAHQLAVSHSLAEVSARSLKIRFFSLTRGPSASTCLHLCKASQ